MLTELNDDARAQRACVCADARMNTIKPKDGMHLAFINCSYHSLEN